MTTTVKHSTRHGRTGRGNNHLSEIREHAATMGEAMRGMAASAGAAATDQLDPLEDYVRKQPIKSLLFAAAAGALFGLIFLRR